MTDAEHEPDVPLSTATVWPPAPVCDAEQPPVYLAVEGVEFIQYEGRLVVSRKYTRRRQLFQTFFGVIPFLFVLATPSILSFLGHLQYPLQFALLPFVRLNSGAAQNLYLTALLSIPLFMFLLSIPLSHSTFVVDKSKRTIKTGGSVRSISEIMSVQIIKATNNVRAPRFGVLLVQKDVHSFQRWRKSLDEIGSQYSVLRSFQQEANAEKIADAIADFLDVPVQHRTTVKNSV